MQEKLNVSVQLLKAEKAKKVAKLVRLNTKMQRKRKLGNSDTIVGQKKKWKKIRSMSGY